MSARIVFVLIFISLIEFYWIYAVTSFSTKTAYQPNLNTSRTLPDGYRAVQIIMVSRHGTRFPTGKGLKEIQNLYEKLMASCLNPVINYILRSATPYRVADEGALTDSGAAEMYGLGRRMAARYPEISMQPYSYNRFVIRSTCVKRCGQSANAFSLGFFEGKGLLGPARLQSVAVDVSPCDNDPLLRFFSCGKRKDQLVSVMDSKEDTTSYSLLSDALQRVRQACQLVPGKDLSTSDLKAIFKACAFNISILNGSRHEGLCSLLNDDDMNKLEFMEDLSTYKKNIGDLPPHLMKTCPLLQSIVDSLEVALESGDLDESVQKGIFMFAHAETLIPFYYSMGLHYDLVTTRATANVLSQDHLFRPGRDVTFGANIAFVSAVDQGGHKTVQVLLNERPIMIPCCQSTLCSFVEFKACYMSLIERCKSAGDVCSPRSYRR